jgi:nucleoside-diphosphate kinase
MKEKTLLIIKPDAVRKRVVGKIITLLEENGFELLGIVMKRLSREEAEKFYSVHRGKPFYEGLVNFIISGPVVAILLEKEEAIRNLREVVGATDPSNASPNTIRALFGTNVRENAVHASDSPDSARYEIPFFFQEEL